MKIDQNSLEIVRTFFLQDFLKRDVFRSLDDFFRYHILVFVLLDHDGMVQGRKQGNRCIQNLSDDDLYVGYYSRISQKLSMVQTLETRVGENGESHRSVAREWAK
mmetsp:Transcript_7887/g.19351  ORF Transcript_7887/g.19351 Transcript_7887/m.19351 type:complete len:105 (-) Transcript_7887:132-446(-)